MTEETKQKISKAMMGNKNRKGKKFSDQALQDRSKINKDKIVYNNGEHNVFLHIGEEIPEGYVEGRYVSEEEHEKLSNIYKEINDRRWHNGESNPE